MSYYFFCKRVFHSHFLQNPSLKSFTTVSTTTPLSFTVGYLINSCGLSLETALSTSQRLHLKERNLQKLDSLITLLESHGFTKTHISKLITKFPIILQSSVENTIMPKIKFLLEIGYSKSNIPELVLSNTNILKKSLNNQLKPSFNLLKSFLHTNDNVMKACKRSKWLLTYDLKQTMAPNVTFLVNEGVPISSISYLIMTQPRTVMQGPTRFIQNVQAVKKLGIPPNSRSFVHTVQVMTSMSKATWDRKLIFFKSLGWSEEHVMRAFKREPHFISCSEGKIEKMMDFFVNTLQLESSVFCMHPKLLMCGLDKRIIPSEKRFLDKIVIKYVEKVPDLMEVYHGSIAAK
ncbi:uncharacterized protein LOC143853048 isoform X2 [Tasmannia lanceolata]|uniref:uncharacterized protein LOC143853048 isoform X2 n=1 Tax=Tasmannia lanceolata TaxID=3420 RepID=UPI004064471A